MKLNSIAYVPFRNRLKRALDCARDESIYQNYLQREYEKECALIKPYLESAYNNNLPISYSYIAKKTGLPFSTVYLRISYNQELCAIANKIHTNQSHDYTQEQIMRQHDDIEKYLTERKQKQISASIEDIARDLNMDKISVLFRIRVNRTLQNLYNQVNTPRGSLLNNLGV
ncbi:MAG: hypothetical protein IJ877_02165 [Candidatus Gastranaerophilales bacterium]|nr:hypothetical protein [Candidatus Gastranaerophilales bacterium]